MKKPAKAFVFMFSMFLSVAAFAQDDNGNHRGGGNNGNGIGNGGGTGGSSDGGGVPLDGGLSLLLAAGAGYGVKKIADRRKAIATEK